MIYRLHVVQAIAENPKPTGDRDTLLYCQWTMPDFMLNSLLDAGHLGKVLTWEIQVMSDALTEQGVDPRTVRWEGHISMPYDSEEYADVE